MFEICIVKTNTEIDENTFNYLLSFIQPEKKERILKQRVSQNAYNMLIGELTAKIGIKKAFGIPIASQKFIYSGYGKPYLSDDRNIHFNISHSGEYVACVVSNKSVGIDIQRIEQYNPNVAEKVCNAQELLQISNSGDKSSEFIKLWTQKEAVLKMYGVGIANADIKNCLKNVNTQSKKIDEYWLSVCLNE